MKTLLSLVLALSFNIIIAQNPSVLVEIESTNQGFLPPVMTEEQMTNIPSPPVGLMVFCSDCRIIGPHFYSGTNWLGPTNEPHNLSSTDVYNPITGRIWMDRNLGATQVATSSSDSDSYGYIYQWGRLSDGHQLRTSDTTSTLSSTDVPGHDDWILGNLSPFDWRSPQNDDLWQGVSGINNPCPTGYRLPTEEEWEDERLSWISNDAAGAFDSPLKLPLGGNRGENQYFGVGTVGVYWSSTTFGNFAQNLVFNNFTNGSGTATIQGLNRSWGASVRCIKE